MAGQVEGDDPDRGDHGVQRTTAPDERLRADGQVARHRSSYGQDADGCEGRDDQEHRAPAEEVDQCAGDERAGDRRHHPGRGEQREDARAQVRRVAVGHRDVERRQRCPAAETLQQPTADQDLHRAGEPGDEETGHEADAAQRHGQAGAAGIAPDASDDHPDDRGGEHPDDRDRVERLPAEVARHARHRQADRDRLEREHGDQRQQTDRDGAVLLVEGTRRSVGPGHGHGRQSTTSSMVEVKWKTPSC